MAWIAVQQSLLTHRKTMAVADALDIPDAQVIGHLVALWLWAIDNAPDGSLQGVTPRMVARAALWHGDPDQFVNALVSAGFLDQCEGFLAIHDWDDHARKLIERRQQDAERKRLARAAAAHKMSEGRPADILRTSAPTLHNNTLPNQTTTESSPAIAPPPGGTASGFGNCSELALSEVAVTTDGQLRELSQTLRGEPEEPCVGGAEQPGGQGEHQPEGQDGDSSSLTLSPPDAGNKKRVADAVREIYEYYCLRWRDVFSRDPELTEKRRRHIAARLRRWSVEELKRAIDNMHEIPFYRGENEAGEVYGTIDYLFRNDENVDKMLNRPVRAGPKGRARPWQRTPEPPERVRQEQEAIKRQVITL